MVERLAAAALGLRQPAQEPATANSASECCHSGRRGEERGQGSLIAKVVLFVVEHGALVVAVEEQGGHGGKAGGLGAVAQDEGEPHAEVEVAHAAVDLRQVGQRR